MEKISSRTSAEDLELHRLRVIIDVATGGAISAGGELRPADTLEGLVTQVDITCASLLQAMLELEREQRALADDNRRLSAHVGKQEAVLREMHDALEAGVEYDEELDHATADMMQALMASGAADSTFDGEISFSESIALSKEDMKPIVRTAIESWLRLKLGR
jgi:hypothetical protein